MKLAAISATFSLVLGRTAIAEQLHGERWGRQHDNDCEDWSAHSLEQQETSEAVNRLVQLLYDWRGQTG